MRKKDGLYSILNLLFDHENVNFVLVSLVFGPTPNFSLKMVESTYKKLQRKNDVINPFFELRTVNKMYNSRTITWALNFVSKMVKLTRKYSYVQQRFANFGCSVFDNFYKNTFYCIIYYFVKTKEIGRYICFVHRTFCIIIFYLH